MLVCAGLTDQFGLSFLAVAVAVAVTVGCLNPPHLLVSCLFGYLLLTHSMERKFLVTTFFWSTLLWVLSLLSYI